MEAGRRARQAEGAARGGGAADRAAGYGGGMGEGGEAGVSYDRPGPKTVPESMAAGLIIGGPSSLTIPS